MRKKNHLGRSHSAERQSFGRVIQQTTMPPKMLCNDEKKENGAEFDQNKTVPVPKTRMEDNH